MTGVRCRVGVAALACVSAAACVPLRFEDGVRFYADVHGVRDASVRRARGGAYWHLRFDAMMLGDLDAAIALGSRGDTAGMRRAAAEVMRNADRLARKVFDGEIERMPAEGRARLAALAGCADTIDALKLAYRERADVALGELVERLNSGPEWRTRWELLWCRRNVEPAYDDQGRLLRQITLGWAGIPAWMGLAAEEAKTEAKTQAKLSKDFERVVLWRPSHDRVSGEGQQRTRAEHSEIARRFAPTIAMRWPAERPYPEDDDRLGMPVLSGGVEKTEVEIDVSRPVVYSYLSQTMIQGRRHQQIVYVWWFPERPAMTPGDPAAGRIDGNTLRVTLDLQGRPSVFEVMLNCGCGHLVFVDERAETDACHAFGGPESGKRHCVARAGAGLFDVVVAGTTAVPQGGTGPVVYVDAGYHEVCRIGWPDAGGGVAEPVVETAAYELLNYDALDRLPLGEGVGSMFGADGLVHFAGRREGILLAPTGILSAGQPRKRGTHKIRWDAFAFDDPHLLERTLRLADGF